MAQSQGTKRLIVDLPAVEKDKLEKEKITTGKSIKEIILEALELYYKKNRPRK